MSKTLKVIPGDNCSVICYAIYFLTEITLLKHLIYLQPKNFA